MGVSEAVLPAEKMDYTKPDFIIPQLEEKPDSLDKASSGLTTRNMRERPMVYMTVHTKWRGLTVYTEHDNGVLTYESSI